MHQLQQPTVALYTRKYMDLSPLWTELKPRSQHKSILDEHRSNLDNLYSYSIRTLSLQLMLVQSVLTYSFITQAPMTKNDCIATITLTAEGLFPIQR